jgi:hypothetical protein
MWVINKLRLYGRVCNGSDLMSNFQIVAERYRHMPRGREAPTARENSVRREGRRGRTREGGGEQGIRKTLPRWPQCQFCKANPPWTAWGGRVRGSRRCLDFLRSLFNNSSATSVFSPKTASDGRTPCTQRVNRMPFQQKNGLQRGGAKKKTTTAKSWTDDLIF